MRLGKSPKIRQRIHTAVLKYFPARLKNIITAEFKRRSFYNFQNLSYSQEGEDLVLGRFFENKVNGFYVDIGAHHPVRFSNTFKFYLNGWRGINIDPMPGCMIEFEKLRPNDINLEIPISDKRETLTYFIFNEPALNTFSENEAARKNGHNSYRIIEKKQLKMQRLDSILDKYLPNDTHIDFISIDVEGLDLKVLKSNNWKKYRPDLVLVEDLQSDIEKLFSTELYNFMKLNGYKLVARTFNTLFFRRL